jgi:hypothetical protein
MLVVGLICNLLVRPVDAKYFMTESELAEEKRLAHESSTASTLVSYDNSVTSSLTVALAWLAVSLPLAWGVYRTVLSVGKFFN